MSNQTSVLASSAYAVDTDALAPDLLALFLGAQPHPDVVIPRPLVTVAGLAAAARAAAPDPGAPVALRWDGPGQRLTG